MTDTRFIQLHLLVSYPPSNPNRDDLGQPKTAIMGGKQRSRISSQSLKRAWRTSKIWKNDGLNIGIRTRELFLDKEKHFYETLVNRFGDERAEELTGKILGKFAKVASYKKKEGESFNDKYKDKKIVTEQPIHFSKLEVERILDLILRFDGNLTDEQLESLLDDSPNTVDLAMFGRMIAKRPDHNRDAAVQVAHAISVNEVEIEDDFFTAVDDLNKHGSAHMNEQQFVSAIYYLYLCIDHELLISNLGEKDKPEKEMTKKALKALVKSAAMIAPSGKQNSYGNNVQAFYILAEKGDAQPRNLSLAFIKPISADDPENAIKKLQDIKCKFNEKYLNCLNTNENEQCKCTCSEKEMNLFGDGTLDDILTFVAGE